MASAITTTTDTTGTVAAPITAADQERIDQALQDSRSANTQYRSTWRGWADWCAGHGHATMPADPIHVAAYLAERTEQGAVAATVRTIRAAIGAAHRDQGADDPTAHDGVRHVLQGLGRQAAGRGRGQAGPHRRRLRRDHRNRRDPQAHRTRHGIGSGRHRAGRRRRGNSRRAVQGGLRRSEAAALRWGDVQDATDGAGVLVRVRRSKTDQGRHRRRCALPKNGAAAAVRKLRDNLTIRRSRLRPDDQAPVLGGLNGTGYGGLNEDDP